MAHPLDPHRPALADELSRELLTYEADGRTTLHIVKALARSDDLLTLPRTELAQQSLREHVEVLRSGEQAIERLAKLEKEEDSLSRRMRRVRNSLTHGNPVTVEAITSVDNYLMYMTEFALEEAITSPVDKPLAEVLAEYQAQRANDRARLEAGEEPVTVLGLLPS